MEQWKDIEGYEGVYQISSLGRVKRLPHGNSKGRIRKLRAANNGYLYVVLSKDNVPQTIRVHREVAKAFIPNPLNLETVNHKNFDKTDNRVENLEWMTERDNVLHAKRNGMGNNKPVYQCDMSNNIIRKWNSAYEVELKIGFFATLISRCCRGEMKSYKGYKWKFV